MYYKLLVSTSQGHTIELQKQKLGLILKTNCYHNRLLWFEELRYRTESTLPIAVTDLNFKPCIRGLRKLFPELYWILMLGCRTWSV